MTLLIPQGTSLGISTPGAGVFTDIIAVDRFSGYVMTERALQLGWNGVAPLHFSVLWKPVYLISHSALVPSFRTGVPPAGSTLSLIIEAGAKGYGRGGDAGDYAGFGANGQRGGTALKAEFLISIDSVGELAAGGGGGARGGHANYSHGGPGGGGRPLGKGGQGVPPYNNGTYQNGTYGASPATDGTLLLPGLKGLGGPGAGNGSDGGDLATAAANATAGELTAGGIGGLAGNCIEGNAFITWINPGTRIGAIVP